ncbi:hypothetical protein BY458DRAFT_502210, partial [Sporodiniella umbellata]
MAASLLGIPGGNCATVDSDSTHYTKCEILYLPISVGFTDLSQAVVKTQHAVTRGFIREMFVAF